MSIGKVEDSPNVAFCVFQEYRKLPYVIINLQNFFLRNLMSFQRKFSLDETKNKLG